jgi:hypothetical protein
MFASGARRGQCTLQFGVHVNHRFMFSCIVQSKSLYMIVDAPWYVPNSQIRLSEGISNYQQLKKKSAAIALNIVLASAHIQMT